MVSHDNPNQADVAEESSHQVAHTTMDAEFGCIIVPDKNRTQLFGSRTTLTDKEIIGPIAFTPVRMTTKATQVSLPFMIQSGVSSPLRDAHTLVALIWHIARNTTSKRLRAVHIEVTYTTYLIVD